MAHSPLTPDDQLAKPVKSHSLRGRSLYERWITDWWLGEVLAVLLGCGLTVALCIILATYDEQPVPTFGSFFNSGITLGTLVALLSTLSVAAAIVAVQECISQLKWLWYSGRDRPLQDMETYDEASRGLIGSAKLLWVLRLPPVASIGALLVLLHLAVVPLAQQSLLSVSMPVPIAGANASVPVSHRWSDSHQQISAPTTPEQYTVIGTGMKAAILSGLFSAAPINNTVPVCTSGNCTFDDYQSLAMCSATADVTSSLKNETSTVDGKRTSRWCLPGSHCIVNEEGDSFVINVTSAASNLDKHEHGYVSLNFASVAFPDFVSPLADVYMIYPNMTTDNHNGNHWVASELLLHWCVPTFTTQVVNGTASTTRLPNPVKNFTHPGIAYAATVNGSKFEADDDAHTSLQRYLATLFNGSVAMSGADVFADAEPLQALASMLGFGGQNSVTQGTAAQTLARLNGVLANTSTSVTNYIRGPWALSPRANGTVWGQQERVQVSWGWLAAPILFSAMSLIFVVAVIVLGRVDRKARPHVWKSSTLAALHGLDPGLQRALGGIVQRGAMHDGAGELYVRLIQDGDGWRLVESELSAGNKKSILLAPMERSPTRAPEQSSERTMRLPFRDSQDT